jgi:hypothetical protein
MPVMHPHTRLVMIDERTGWGVVATRPIPRGTVTWLLGGRDRVFSPAEWQALPDARRTPFLQKYTHVDAGGSRIVCWDHGSFENHSCRATCQGTAYGFEIAVRDLAEGEELRIDYAPVMPREEVFACTCGEPSCRRNVSFVEPRPEPDWPRDVGQALASIDDVPQELFGPWQAARERWPLSEWHILRCRRLAETLAML